MVDLRSALVRSINRCSTDHLGGGKSLCVNEVAGITVTKFSGSLGIRQPRRRDSSGGVREGGPVPHVGLPAKFRGAVAGAGTWVARCGPGPGVTGKCAGEVREGVRGRTRGACAGAGSARSRAGAGRARAGARWRRSGARRAVGGRSPGRGAQVLLTGALKILQRVRAAGGGVVRQAPQGVHAAAARPAGGGAVRFDGEPRREPGRQGRAGWP